MEVCVQLCFGIVIRIFTSAFTWSLSASLKMQAGVNRFYRNRSIRHGRVPAS